MVRDGSAGLPTHAPRRPKSACDRPSVFDEDAPRTAVIEVAHHHLARERILEHVLGALDSRSGRVLQERCQTLDELGITRKSMLPGITHKDPPKRSALVGKEPFQPSQQADNPTMFLCPCNSTS